VFRLFSVALRNGKKSLDAVCKFELFLLGSACEFCLQNPKQAIQIRDRTREGDEYWLQFEEVVQLAGRDKLLQGVLVKCRTCRYYADPAKSTKRELRLVHSSDTVAEAGKSK
jgi:hypothetical protein